MERYEAQYGKPPGNASVLGRMVADLVVMALERAGRDLTVDSFVDAMESIQDYKAFGAEVSFGPDKHDGLEKSRLTVVENGRWKTITGPLGY
jgi:branched-chain amino acid transport system substrate-binding protein